MSIRTAFMHYMKIVLTTVCTIFFLINLFAQHETDERILGFKYKLKFNNNVPEVITQNSNLFDPHNSNYKGVWQTPHANSICDTLGNLLFYYDGAILYQANGQVMNGGNLHQYNFSSHYTSSLIVPIEESNRRYYYLFETLPHEENWDYARNVPINCPVNITCFGFRDLCKLEYSIIDMHANGGRGSIVKKNIFIADSVAPSISGIKHANNIDTWVSVLGFHTNKIYNYQVNSCQIKEPIINLIPDFEYKQTPMYIPYTSLNTNFQIVYSTKGDYVTFPGNKISDNPSASYIPFYLFIAPFDNQTGIFDFNSLKTVDVLSGFNANLFSHDSKYLYYHDSRLFTANVWIYQYDLNTEVSVPFYFNKDQNVYCGADYGKTNDILILKLKRFRTNIGYKFVNYLGVIKHIDQLFVAGNLIDSLSLPVMDQPDDIPQYTYIARNNYIYNFYHPDYKKPDAFPVAASITNTVTSPSCFNAPVALKGNTNIPVDSLYWIVKKAGQNNWQRYDTDTFDLSVSPGTYTVSLVSYKYCLADTATQQFVIEDYPVVHLSIDTLYTCESKPLELPVNNSYQYHWLNADGEIISGAVTETGQYNIAVQNSCSTREDSLYLSNSTIDVTNLVTANNDHQNDCLHITSGNANEIIRLSIYNSWGSRIFSADEYANNWCPGNELTDGVYYYEATYNNQCSKKGWVEIVR